MPRRPYNRADYDPYHLAKSKVHEMGIENWREWWAVAKAGQLPDGVPKDPSKVYIEFTSWSEFLGSKNKSRNNHYASIEVAMQYARERGIKNQAEWTQHCKEMKAKSALPAFIPTDLRRTYGDEFKRVGGMRGFLGRAIMPYGQALQFARAKKFTGIRDFERWATSGERLASFPRHPHLTYKDRFVSYRHFLGLPMKSRESAAKLQELVDVIESDITLKKSLRDFENSTLTISALTDMLNQSELKKQKMEIINTVREIKKAGHHNPLETIQVSIIG